MVQWLLDKVNKSAFQLLPGECLLFCPLQMFKCPNLVREKDTDQAARSCRRRAINILFARIGFPGIFPYGTDLVLVKATDIRNTRWGLDRAPD